MTKSNLVVKARKKNLENKLQNICSKILEETIKELESGFIKNVLDIPSIDGILPENTKFCKIFGEHTIFVIEQKPTVRTLTFRRRASQLMSNGDFNLALPYIIFIPVFKGKSFVEMHIACRTSPLSKLDDMLYHTNLPNSGHLYYSYNNDHDINKWPKNGDVKNSELRICHGYDDFYRDSPFYVTASTYYSMCEQLINHFWSSQFTDELSVYYAHMVNKDPENFGTLKRWETATKNDPLFTLNVKWLEAIHLDKFLDMLSRNLSCSDESIIKKQVTTFVAEIYKSACVKISNNWSQRLSVNINKIFARKLVEVLNRFSAESCSRLNTIDNEVLCDKMVLIIKESLKGS